MKKLVVFSIAMWLVAFVARVQAQTTFGTVTNITTASCHDPRVTRGTVVATNTTTCPNGCTFPVISYNLYLWSQFYCWTVPYNIVQKSTKNAAGTFTTQIIKYSDSCGTGLHKVVIANLNAPNVSCINPDGTSCGATVTLDTAPLCE